MSKRTKEVSPEEFDALVEKAKGARQPKSFASMIAESGSDCPNMCVVSVPSRIESMLTGCSEVRFSRTHCKAVYIDGIEETYELLPPELEKLNENTPFNQMVSLIQSKRKGGES